MRPDLSLPTVALARLDGNGFSELEATRSAGWLPISALGEARLGAARWSGPLLIGELYGIGDGWPSNRVILTRPEHQEAALEQARFGPYGASIIGLAQGERLGWYTREGPAFVTPLAQWLYTIALQGPGHGWEISLAERLGPELEPTAVKVKRSQRRLLVGPMFVTVSDGWVDPDIAWFHHREPEISTAFHYYTPGVGALELATYDRLRRDGVKPGRARATIELLSV